MNMTRPPNRSVSAPTTTRPSAPTRIGVATSIDASVLLSDMLAGVGGGQRADHVPGPEVDGGDPRGQRQVHASPRAGFRRRSSCPRLQETTRAAALALFSVKDVAAHHGGRYG